MVDHAKKGRYSKAKGANIEREFAKRLTEAGVPSRRVVMSGAASKLDKRLEGDVQVGLLPGAKGGRDYLFVAEAKARKDGSGFALVERWLGDNDMLFLRRNHKSPLVVLPWDTFRELLYARYRDEIS